MKKGKSRMYKVPISEGVENWLTTKNLPKYDDVTEEDCMIIDKCSKGHDMDILDKSQNDKTC